MKNKTRQREMAKAAPEAVKTTKSADQIKEWLAIRKKAGSEIDPETAEISVDYRYTLDPYGIGLELPEEDRCIGKEYFARSPRSTIWVCFGDLPDATLHALWAKLALRERLPLITSSDLNKQFSKLAEPFLLLDDIENGVRRMLRGKFTVAELKAAKFPDDTECEVEDVDDLPFEDLRYEFVERLEKIKEIRNDVMHFDADGLEDEDLTTLREFAQLLKRLGVGAM